MSPSENDLVMIDVGGDVLPIIRLLGNWLHDHRRQAGGGLAVSLLGALLPAMGLRHPAAP